MDMMHKGISLNNLVGMGGHKGFGRHDMGRKGPGGYGGHFKFDKRGGYGDFDEENCKISREYS